MTTAAQAPHPRVAICMTTHDRVDCARINQEIIKLNYPKDWVVVHACSDPAYAPYLEDELIRCEPLPLCAGALNLLQQSVRAAMQKYRPDYIVHLEADTWILRFEVIASYIEQLSRHPTAVVAASSWGSDKALFWRDSNKRKHKLKYISAMMLRRIGIDYGRRGMDSLSTQFFVAKTDPRFIAVIEAMHATTPVLEVTFFECLNRLCGRESILSMKEREPVHPNFRWMCEPLSLYCQHWPALIPLPPGATLEQYSHYNLPGKRDVLLRAGGLKRGPNMEKLLAAEDLRYYNGAAKRS